MEGQRGSEGEVDKERRGGCMAQEERAKIKEAGGKKS